MSSTGKSRQASHRPALRRPSKRDLADLKRRDALVLEHLDWARGIAAAVAHKLPSWFTADDLTGPAEIGLIQAAERYQASTGVPFRAYARTRVYGACVDSARRREYKERGHQSLDEAVVGEDGPREVSLAEQIRDPGPSPEQKASDSEMEAVWDQVRKLPKQYRLLIERVYADGRTLVELAERSGLGESRLSQIHRKALGMLREMVEEGTRAA